MITCRDIYNIVQDYFDIDLSKNTRVRPYPLAKQFYFYNAKKYAHFKSLDEIGSLVNRKHANVIIMSNRLSDLLDSKGKYFDEFKHIQNEIEKKIMHLKEYHNYSRFDHMDKEKLINEAKMQEDKINDLIFLKDKILAERNYLKNELDKIYNIKVQV